MMHHLKYCNDSFEKYFSQNINVPFKYSYIYLDSKKFAIGSTCPDFKEINRHREFVSKIKKTGVIVTDQYLGIRDNSLISKNCIIFSSNSNNDNLKAKIIHIPLLNNKQVEIETKPVKNRKYFYSFVGWNNCKLRDNLKEIRQKNSLISYERINNNLFNEVMADSIFSLCPRGIEASSYRICESLRNESIPVYISDIFVLPEDFEKYGILVQSKDFDKIPEILSSYSVSEIENMIEIGKVYYKKIFTYEGLGNWIVEKLNNM